MSGFSPQLHDDIRSRFAMLDRDPEQGERIFFENAGGALTLNSVVECSKTYAAIPDNQGRDNPSSNALDATIARARADLKDFANPPNGQFVFGESGTELAFRLIMNACLGTGSGGIVLGSTIEHPATSSATARWAPLSGKTLVLVPHDNDKGLVTPQAYAEHVTKDTKVATILHTSPVTGMGMELAEIAKAIRSTSPDCFIIVDGIQHAAHGQIDLASYDVDGYVISPYKMFSRHGYGVAWISDRLTALPHDGLVDGPKDNWELGTRDTGAYATMSEAISYIEWLGGESLGGESKKASRRDKFIAAGKAIHDHEKTLTQAAINGAGNLPGLRDMKGITILGGADNPAREGLVSFVVEGMDCRDVVARLSAEGIRTHVRAADHYSKSVLDPLGLEACVRASMCHYNSVAEITQLLTVMKAITDEI